jgi:ribosomal protein S6--L-glutamate ligase
VPCVNDAAVLLRGYERLSMLAELRSAGLPVIPFDVAVGDGMARRLAREFPFVVKAGNHHAGYGKVLVKDAEQWSDVADLLFAVDDYVTVEPFIDYRRDVRCLAIGERMWSMVREGAAWKANVDTRRHQVIDPPPQVAEWTRTAMRHLGADTLALDFLEKPDGGYVLLESNDVPGLSGFPEQVRQELVDRLREKLG